MFPSSSSPSSSSFSPSLSSPASPTPSSPPVSARSSSGPSSSFAWSSSYNLYKSTYAEPGPTAIEAQGSSFAPVTKHKPSTEPCNPSPCIFNSNVDSITSGNPANSVLDSDWTSRDSEKIDVGKMINQATCRIVPSLPSNKPRLIWKSGELITLRVYDDVHSVNVTKLWNSRSFNTDHDTLSGPLFQMKAILRRKLLGNIPKFITRGETSLRVHDVHKTSRLSCAQDAKNGAIISVRDLQRCYTMGTKGQWRFWATLVNRKGDILNYRAVILPTFLHKSSP